AQAVGTRLQSSAGLTLKQLLEALNQTIALGRVSPCEDTRGLIIHRLAIAATASTTAATRRGSPTHAKRHPRYSRIQQNCTRGATCDLGEAPRCRALILGKMQKLPPSS